MARPKGAASAEASSGASAMAQLAGRRLIIVAGKGGVGKTTTSAAIALELARLGRRTLLVTVDPAKRLEDSLGVPVGFTETPVQPNLAAMMLDPESVIREHLRERVPDAGATVADHPLFKQVAQAMPGLNELMAIGKLNDFRREGKYEAIVVDTAPTGHALSFLGAPKAIRSILRERSLVAWAVKGYAVYQKLSGAARSFGNILKKESERKAAPPDIDFERIFDDMEAEAARIEAFLRDPEHSALVVVTLPEKLPVEETCDLHATLTKELDMRVHAVVVNKVQPDPLGPHAQEFERMAGDAAARQGFAQAAAKATGHPPALVEAMVASTEFSRIRRDMNLAWLKELRQRLPEVPQVEMPLFRQDVQGLRRLGEYRSALFAGVAPAGGKAEGHEKADEGGQAHG